MTPLMPRWIVDAPPKSQMPRPLASRADSPTRKKSAVRRSMTNQPRMISGMVLASEVAKAIVQEGGDDDSLQPAQRTRLDAEAVERTIQDEPIGNF